MAATATVPAQEVTDWHDYFYRMTQSEDAESQLWEQSYDLLSELADNPLDLNECTRTQLEALPFISAAQVMDIMEYRDRYKRIESMAELMMIPSLDRTTIELLSRFVTIRPSNGVNRPSQSLRLAPVRQTLTAYIKWPFYDRKGDKNGYLGYKLKHWMRYNIRLGNHISAGLTASQDAGEPFFSAQNSMGYDYYSAYVMLRNYRRIKTLVVGRYRLKTGLGLVLNNRFGMGKLIAVQSLGKTSPAIAGHASRSEYNYLQGAAATISLSRRMDLTAFASWRKIDATMRKDTTAIATILRTGYHRTPSEMERRRNATQTLAGANAYYTTGPFHFGLTALHTALSPTLMPDKGQRYRHWYPEGRQFWNASADYGMVTPKWTIAGETATGNSKSVATLNTVSYKPSQTWMFTLIHRYYTYQYQALFAESFAEGGHINNENGLYLSVTARPGHHITLTAYTDYAYFAWDRYLLLAGSHVWDNYVKLEYDRKHWHFTLSHRSKMQNKNNSTKTALMPYNLHRSRLIAAYNTPTWHIQTQADMAISRDSEQHSGWMLTQKVQKDFAMLTLQAGICCFRTDNYATGLYVYEPGMMYTFSFPKYYGKGCHLYLNIKADISGHITVMGKAAFTRYTDRDKIATALQQIDGNHTTDAEVQLNWKF